MPGAGTTVTCTGADPTGISGNAANVTVNVDSGASISTTGVSAIDLGTGANVTISNASVSSNTTTVTLDSGSLTLSLGSITSSAGTAIQYTGAANTLLQMFINGTVSGVGTAVDFSNARATFSLNANAVINGNVLAGAGTQDRLRLGTSGAGTFNVSNIGTQYTGFDLFEKQGTGTFTLTGTGNQNWNITGGTLQGDTTSMAGSLTVNGANVTFNQNTNGTYGSVISGNGTVTKLGTGTVTFTGTNIYSGGTAINAGRLDVDGTIAGTTTVGASGTLGGTGTTATVVNNGMLAPGSSIGTLNVGGNLTFNNGSVYQVEVDDALNSDRSIATGTVTINGGSVDVQATAGNYAPSNLYTILQGSSVTGTFTGGVTSNLAFLDPFLIYNATDVQLRLDRNDQSFSIVAQDPNQQDMANAVQQLGAGSGVHDAFVGLSTAQATQALQVLSGEHNTSLSTTSLTSNSAVRNIVTDRMQNMSHNRHQDTGNFLALRSIEPASGEQQNKDPLDALRAASAGHEVVQFFSAVDNMKSGWVKVFGSMGNSDSQKSVASQKRRSGGVIYGMDMETNDRFIVGAFGGYERGEIYTDLYNANSDLDSVHGGVYANYSPFPAWRLSTGLTGTYHDIDTTRHISFTGFSDTAKGETNGYTISGYVEGGYSHDLGYFAIEPFAGINTSYNNIDSYEERSNFGAALYTQGETKTVFGHTIGVRMAKSFDFGEDNNAFQINGKIAWDRNYGDLSSKSTMRFAQGSTFFNDNGLDIDRDVLSLGLGINTKFVNKTNAYMNYDGTVSANHRDHSLTVGIKYNF